MAALRYKRVFHDHEAFLKKTLKRKAFRKAYGDLEEEYRLTRKMLLLARLMRNRMATPAPLEGEKTLQRGGF